LTGLGLSGCGREDAKRPWKGAAFPGFTLPEPDGTLHHSREYLGRPLLINFWATWCAPCRKEMVDLDSLHRQLGPRGLQLLAISVDADRNLLREYLRQKGFGFRVLVDGDQQWSAPALRIQGFPTTYLIGNDGLIRDAWVGPRLWADPATQAEIAAAVGLA
jgi:peroxiredoxin